MNEILGLEGQRLPPIRFVKQLERFDPNLRVVWGLSLANPFPGWVVERRIPEQMKARVYGDPRKPSNRQRYYDQAITDNGAIVGRRRFDAMPDWHPVYICMDDQGKPVPELGEFVIDYLRRHYDRTLLGFPELGMKHHAEDQAEKEAREMKRNDELLEQASRKVMEHKTEIWHEYFAHGGQPETLKEGTDVYDHLPTGASGSPRTAGKDADAACTDRGSSETGCPDVGGDRLDLERL